MMHTETFEISYTMVDEPDRYDVEFTVSKDAEERLFSAIGSMLHDEARDRRFDEPLIHFYAKLDEQRQLHPPWFETNHDRTYDLELTDEDYSTLSSIVGQVLDDRLGPEGSDVCAELVDVWRDVTEQIGHQQAASVAHDTPQTDADRFDPSNGTFQCLLDDGTVACYTSDDGDRWYRCLDCETMFAEISEDHDCDA